MESYVPLVKAIIISTMFSWGTSTVTITDHYIIKERNVLNQFEGQDSHKDYQIYDLSNNTIRVIPSSNLSKFFSYGDSRDHYEIYPQGDWGVPIHYNVIKTTTGMEKWGEYKCKEEVKKVQFGTSERSSRELIDKSYFAKLPWLDEILDTKDKREFAGFERQEYSPYHYLVYEVYEYADHTSKDQVIRIIEKSEVDTTFIHTLLTLPLNSGK
jgi:hypothetical protein